MNETFYALVADVLVIFIGGTLVLSLLQWIDRMGKKPVEIKAILVRKWPIWQYKLDHTLRPMDHYYGRVMLDGEPHLVRLHEDDFDILHNGSHVTATIVTGWSGRKYVLSAKPK